MPKYHQNIVNLAQWFLNNNQLESLVPRSEPCKLLYVLALKEIRQKIWKHGFKISKLTLNNNIINLRASDT